MDPSKVCGLQDGVGVHLLFLHRLCTSLLLYGTTFTNSQKIEKTLSTFVLQLAILRGTTVSRILKYVLLIHAL